MHWKKIKKLSNDQFRRITGVRMKTFIFMVNLLKPTWIAKRLAEGPIPKLQIEDQLLLALSYWRNYGTYLETDQLNIAQTCLELVLEDINEKQLTVNKQQQIILWNLAKKEANLTFGTNPPYQDSIIPEFIDKFC